MSVEAWLNGPVEGVAPLLMPVAHSLMQAKADLRSAVSDVDDDVLWKRPGGAASIGFHLRHIPGSADRLLTYALGEGLSSEQMAVLAAEKEPAGPGAAQLLDRIDDTLDRVLEAVRHIPESQLTEVRYVGRARIPSTVIGLLFHIAEHTQRHTGQVIATAKIVRSADG